MTEYTLKQKRVLLAREDADAHADDCKKRTRMEIFLEGVPGYNSLSEIEINIQFAKLLANCSEADIDQVLEDYKAWWEEE